MNFSAASIWEIALKKRIGRVDFAFPPDQIAKAAKESGFSELPVFANAAALVERLPLHHRDPFDHLLIAQAMSEPARLFTVDPLFTRYSELVTILQPEREGGEKITTVSVHLADRDLVGGILV